jgi:hypothetical protein
VRGNGRTLQGYNAQAAATLGQVVAAAELTQQANDLQQLAPMLTAMRATLASAGIGDPVQRLAADSGYWSIANVSTIPDAPELLIPPARMAATASPARTASHRNPRATACARDAGQAGQRPRQGLLRPAQPDYRTSLRPGQDGPRRRPVHAPRAGGLRQAEWKLLCGTHNLLKLWRSTISTS